MRVIAGKARSLKLDTLEGFDIRPTTDRIKETLFNIINGDIYNCTFLDLYAGSGSIGIEALSRGADRVVFVENNRNAAECIKKNLIFTKLSNNAELLFINAEAAICKLYEKKCSFDIIFMDPPYNHGHESRIMEQLQKYNILNHNGIIIIEASTETLLDYPDNGSYNIYREKIYGSNKHVFLRRNTGE